VNDSIRAALVNLIKSNRKKMSNAQRKRGVKPQRWLYPVATEARYAASIRAWFRPMKDYVHTYLKENQEAILHGDSEYRADDVSVTRLDAVPGHSFKVMIDSLDGWIGQYVPEDNESVSGSPIYMGLGKIADNVFDFNEGQFEKGAKSVLGVEFPVGELWWPQARENWAQFNYQTITGDLRKYVRDINQLVERAITSGKTVRELSKQIQVLDDKMSKGRANFIARDQIGRLNGQITQTRMESIGLEMYIWETSGDERVRESHVLIDGGLCRWDDSTVYSEDGGKTWINRPSGAVLLHPGDDYQCRCTAIAYWQELVNEADTMIAQYEELDAIAAQNIAAMPKPAPPVPPEPESKKFITQKILKSEISDLNKQMKALEGKTGEADKKAYQELKAKKEAIEAEIEKRKIRAERKKLTKELKTLEKELDSFEIKTYSGIWKDDVTIKDYEAKAEAIAEKRAYYEMRLKDTGLSAVERARLNTYLQDLKDFELEGKRYAGILASINGNKSRLTSLGKRAILDTGTGNAYTPERKNAALWAKTPGAADKKLRNVCGEVWRGATKAERDALYAYTAGPGGFNRPLRGIDQNKNFKGVGKVPLNNEDRGDAIRNMTNVINRSKYDFDVWLQRGIEQASGASAFLGISEHDLWYWSHEQLQSLVGKPVIDQGFVSCGSSKGSGFSGYIFNIYCPEGTKMMYAEPFSAYGHGARSSSWDGKTGQKTFSMEDETIIQRGTTFRITKVEKKGPVVFFDIEVIDQI